MVLAITPLLRELILAACDEPLDWDLDGRGHYIAELALDEIIRSKAMPIGLPIPSDPRVRRVTDVLVVDPNNERRLEDWADLAGMSHRNLARLFRVQTGLSFRQWRQQSKLTLAMATLATGNTPKQAAAAAGFDSIPAFGVAFRKLFGITPGQARAPIGSE